MSLVVVSNEWQGQEPVSQGSPVHDRTEEPMPQHLLYWRMKASKSAMTEILAGLALAIALGATVYYGYLVSLLVSPD